MRIGGTFIHTTQVTEMTSAEATTTAKATFSPPSNFQRTSPWHSPVPYLFGGLAAMLGLIAFALLILACSYWKLSGQMERDVESDDAEKPDSGVAAKSLPVFEEKYLVIMAGDVKPTYLATPVTSRANSFNDEKNCNHAHGDQNGNVTQREHQTASVEVIINGEAQAQVTQHQS